MSLTPLLDGPDLREGAEPAARHLARLGPSLLSGPELIDALDQSDLRGRGGAGFPVGRKWRSVAGRQGPRALIANGAEGEPLSFKDRLLMQARPHLVLDGAVLAAGAVGAEQIVLYIGREHSAAADAMLHALAERPATKRARIRISRAPVAYVSGEETAAVQFVNRGVALPMSVPPRPFEAGVGGRPTLVQNVESLAAAALIARRGGAWYRSSGTLLVTVTGAVARPGVVETPLGTPVAEVVERAGGDPGSVQALLLGGYFGGWVAADEAWDLPLHPERLRGTGHALGCGVVAPLPADRCGVAETARIVSYLAGQSAGQCGPCVFGLGAIAETLRRIAVGRSRPDDLARLDRWSAELPGRGACRHPDGGAGLVRSALGVFADDFAHHLARRGCAAARPLTAGVA
jgi:NADH:ubiquinone oxidoreductase subunit F (NADH-binding)